MSDLIFKSGKGTYYPVAIDEIQWIEGLKGRSLIHLTNRTLNVNILFSDVLSSLGDSFIQCHRSSAVNSSKIRLFSINKIVLDSTELVLSKSYKPAFMDKMFDESKLLIKRIED